jgi:hypothetical protein
VRFSSSSRHRPLRSRHSAYVVHDGWSHWPHPHLRVSQRVTGIFVDYFVIIIFWFIFFLPLNICWIDSLACGYVRSFCHLITKGMCDVFRMIDHSSCSVSIENQLMYKKSNLMYRGEWIDVWPAPLHEVLKMQRNNPFFAFWEGLSQGIPCSSWQMQEHRVIKEYWEFYQFTTILGSIAYRVTSHGSSVISPHKISLTIDFRYEHQPGRGKDKDG